MARKRRMKCGVVGYGPSCEMGRLHLQSMAAQKVFAPTAVCDLNEERLASARSDFPGIETYTDMGKMLRKSGVELVAVILPHNLHAKAAVRCLNAGCNVVVEKPFALTVEECDAMIAAAKKNRRMLSTFHNRHWDANIVTIMKHIKKIGRTFRWESYQGGWRRPGRSWRSDKKISGGIIFDWGAHFVEWMLQVLPYRMTEISGFGINEVWKHCTNEDELEAVVRFAGGAVGSHTVSHVAAAGKPMIRILGTRGAITATHSEVTVHTSGPGGERIATSVPMVKPGWDPYYRSVRNHLVGKKKLVITPEYARRVIQVLDYATRSSKQGKSLKPKYK